MSNVLEQGEILVLHAASISAGLVNNRIGLLSGIGSAFVATLPHSIVPGEQILVDLDTLNAAGTLTDGSVPLIVWLRNAVALAGTRTEVEIFRGTLERLSGGRTVEQHILSGLTPAAEYRQLGNADVASKHVHRTSDAGGLGLGTGRPDLAYENIGSSRTKWIRSGFAVIGIFAAGAALLWKVIVPGGGREGSSLASGTTMVGSSMSQTGGVPGTGCPKVVIDDVKVMPSSKPAQRFDLDVRVRNEGPVVASLAELNLAVFASENLASTKLLPPDPSNIPNAIVLAISADYELLGPLIPGDNRVAIAHVLSAGGQKSADRFLIHVPFVSGFGPARASVSMDISFNAGCPVASKIFDLNWTGESTIPKIKQQSDSVDAGQRALE